MAELPGNVKALASLLVLVRERIVAPEAADAGSIIFAVCFPDEFKKMNEDWEDFFREHRLRPDGQPIPAM
jgi:hypothetical protein